MSDMKMYSVMLARRQIAAIKAIAERNELAASEIIRRALDEYLDRQPEELKKPIQNDHKQ
jgi:hypothetical protein